MTTVDRERICADLRGLGLSAGDSLMLHSSLRSLGWVEGGADTVVDAILEVIGSDGTLLTPAFTEGAWTDKLAMEDCACNCPKPVCPSTSPSHEGAIPNAALNREGHLRSCHPTHSWVANGGDALAFVKDHQYSPTCCGVDNPFEVLVDRDGWILILGVDVGRITLWHYYEDVLQLPYRGFYHPEERHLSYVATGKRIQYSYPGIMQEVVRESGILREGSVGKSTSGLIRARDFQAFMATAVTDDPYCLLLRPPARDQGSLALDAIAKSRRMLEAWTTKRRERPGTIELFREDRSEPVREDCPAFGGYYEASDGDTRSLCTANGRHPELFRLGGVFDRFGPTTCSVCPWHHRYARKRVSREQQQEVNR